MNIKKYLKKIAQEDLQNIETERDREFLASLKSSSAEEPKKKMRNYQWLWSVPAGVALCTAAVVLPVVLVPAPAADDVKYEEANFIRVDSDVNELLGATKDIKINFAAEQKVNVSKTYDSVSGDDLFYSFVIESGGESYYKAETTIIVNNKYEFTDFIVDETFTTVTYSDYSVICDQYIIHDNDLGFNRVLCKGKIENSKYDIYVMNYEEYSFENGSFLTVIADLFDFSI